MPSSRAATADILGRAWTSLAAEWTTYVPAWRTYAPAWKTYVPAWTTYVPAWRTYAAAWKTHVPAWKTHVPAWKTRVNVRRACTVIAIATTAMSLRIAEAQTDPMTALGGAGYVLSTGPNCMGGQQCLIEPPNIGQGLLHEGQCETSWGQSYINRFEYFVESGFTPTSILSHVEGRRTIDTRGQAVTGSGCFGRLPVGNSAHEWWFDANQSIVVRLWQVGTATPNGLTDYLLRTTLRTRVPGAPAYVSHVLPDITQGSGSDSMYLLVPAGTECRFSCSGSADEQVDYFAIVGRVSEFGLISGLEVEGACLNVQTSTSICRDEAAFSATATGHSAAGAIQYEWFWFWPLQYGSQWFAVGAPPCVGLLDLSLPALGDIYAGCGGTNSSACGGDPTNFTLFVATGQGTPTLTVRSCPRPSLRFVCRVSNACDAQVTDEFVLPPLCFADFNCSGSRELQDIFDFLNAWFTGAAAADFNGVNGITPQDIFDFLNAWFAGCP